MKHTLRFLLTAFILVTIASCKKSSNTTTNPTITFIATLNGASETPANASAGTGTATLTFNDHTKIFNITVTYSGLSGTATGAHIHKGAVGVPGGIEFGFTSLTSPITYTSPALDASQESDLKENLYYVNIHTAAFQGGEIRGQLLRQ